MWLHLVTAEHHMPPGILGQEAKGYEFQIPPTQQPPKEQSSLEEFSTFI